MNAGRLLLVGALAAAACGAPPERPAEPASTPPADAVLTIDGKAIPLADFEAYVSANFDPSELEEPLSPDDDAAVRSRLFDDFVSEQTLLAEASARGIRVGDAEVRAWLSGDAPGDERASAARLDRARRELAVRKLLDALVAERPGTDESALRREVSGRHRVEPNPGRLPFPYRPEGR